MRHRIYIACVLIGFFIYPECTNAVVRYVKPSGTGTTCTSWANACNLPTALGIADATTADQLWVQAGTYAPFALKNGVKIIGGFAGTETQASQSNPTVNLTIVDGGETAQCVTNINSAPSAPAAVLRGFTLRKGRESEGGGMFLDNSDARIVQCIFENNSAGDFGGAVGIRGVGSAQFINCIFRNNGEGATNPLGTKGGGAMLKGIWRADPDGSNEQFLHGSGEPMDLAHDPVENKLYLATTDAIYRMNPDGTGFEEIVPRGAEQIVVDSRSRKLYWANAHPSLRVIRRSNLDGSNVEDFVTATDVGNPNFDIRGLTIVYSCDGRSDLKDFAALQNCFTGEGGGPYGGGCESFDVDADGDVDLLDYAVFFELLTSSHSP